MGISKEQSLSVRVSTLRAEHTTHDVGLRRSEGMDRHRWVSEGEFPEKVCCQSHAAYYGFWSAFSLSGAAVAGGKRRGGPKTVPNSTRSA